MAGDAARCRIDERTPPSSRRSRKSEVGKSKTIQQRYWNNRAGVYLRHQRLNKRQKILLLYPALPAAFIADLYGRALLSEKVGTLHMRSEILGTRITEAEVTLAL